MNIAGLYPGTGGAARRPENEVEAGMVGVNVPIPIPVAYHSFGGWKSSLFGDSHAYGADGIHFFIRTKTVTSGWLHELAAPRKEGAGRPGARLPAQPLTPTQLTEPP